MAFTTSSLRNIVAAARDRLERFGAERLELGDDNAVFRAHFDDGGRIEGKPLSDGFTVKVLDGTGGGFRLSAVDLGGNGALAAGPIILTADNIGFGGNPYLLTGDNLAAIGADTDLAHWGKLQSGLAEIFIESQIGLSGRGAAARDAALTSFTSLNSAAIVEGGYVAIDAVAANGDGAALLAALEALGLERGASFGRLAGGLIPVDALDALANLDLLGFARPVYAMTNVGLTTSQNVQSMNVDYVQSAYGLTGAGITIGFLSDSFATRTTPITTLAQDQTNNDLPAGGVTILADSPTPGTDEGRGMAQLAYDIAPGAQIQFHTAFVSMADFAQGIIDLATAGSDIIVDDVRYFAEPFFQDGVLAQAVDTATAMGAMYFSSAGNYGARSYASAWRPSGQFITVSGVLYELHDFDPGAGVDFTQAITKTGTITSILNWDQPNFSVSGGTGAQSEMVLFNVNGASFATANTINFGGDAIDFFQDPGAFTGMAVGLRVGDVAGYFQYVTLGGSFTVTEFATNSGTSFGHSNAATSISVGATDWVDSGRFAAPYVAGEPMPYLETFSSNGNVPILFDTAGNRLAAPVYRSNVDFTAGDGGNTSFFGSDNPNTGPYTGFEADTFPNFYGTSAAAPNAAAMAALLMQRFPTATREQIETAMKLSALDVQVLWTGVQIGDGPDSRSGWGHIMADRALNQLQAMLNADTIVGLGEAAIISYETDTSVPASPDGVRIVLLTDVAAGTTIYLTDRAWTGSAFTNAAGEGTYTYVAASAQSAGTIITLSHAQLTGAGITLSNTGETLYLYQGGADAPTRFLFAADVADGNAVFGGNLTGTGLTNGLNAVAVQHDNAAYAGSSTQIPATQLLDIATGSRWHGSDQDDIGGTGTYSEVSDTSVQHTFTNPDMLLMAVMTGGGQSDAILRLGNDEAANVGSHLARLFRDNPAFSSIVDLTFDLEGGFYFVVDSNFNATNRIIRGNIADLVSGTSSPSFTQVFATDGLNNGGGGFMNGEGIISIEIDRTANKIYWLDGNIFGDFEGGFQFWEANYDGTGMRLIQTIDSENPDPGFGFPGGVADFAISGNFAYVVHSTGSIDGFGNVTVLQNHILRIDITTGAVVNVNLGTSPAGYTPGRLDPVQGQIIGIDVDQATGNIWFVTQPLSATANAGIFRFVPTTVSGTLNGTLTEIWEQPTNNTHNTLQTFPTSNMSHIEVDEIGGRYYVNAFSDTDTEHDGTPATNESDASIFTGSLAAVAGTAPTLFRRVYEPTANGSPLGMEIDYAPTNTVTGLNVTYTESNNLPNSPAGPVVTPFNNAAIADADNTLLQGATVAITDGFFPGDTLSFTNSGGITGSYNSLTGVVTFTGIASLAAYQTVLNSIRFTNAGDNPTNYGNNTTRTLSITTFDGLANSDPATALLTVVGINDAPVNTVGGTANGTEDVTFAITGVSIADPDADPANEDVQVTLSVSQGTVIILTSVPNGIQLADVSGNGTATVIITATQNQINATFAASGLTYAPAAHYNGADTLVVTTNDLGNNGNDPGVSGTGTSEQDQDNKAITIAAVNDAPTVAGDGTESMSNIFEDQPSAGGQTVSSLFSGQFSDALDQQQTGGNPTGSVANTLAGIAVVGGSTSGSGDWQYFNGSSWVNIGAASTASAQLITAGTAIRFNPALNFNGAAPNLVVHLVDSSGAAFANGDDANLTGATGGTTRYSSATVALGQTVVPVNDAPTSTGLGADAATWTEGGAATLLDVGSNAAIADVDSLDFDTGTLTVSITGALAEDGLFIDTSGTVTTGAGTVSVGGTQIATFTGGGYNGGPLVFTFDADATPAAVQTLIRAIQYNNNAGDNPTEGSRAIVWTLVDGDGVANGGGDTLTVNSSVNVVAVNDPPAGTDNTITINEDNTHVFAAADFGFTDVLDGDVLQSIIFPTLATNGQIRLNGVAIVAGQSVSVTDINNNLLTFVPDANENGAPYASFTFQVQDDGGTLNGGIDTDQTPNTFTFNVTAVNDPPTQTNLSGDIATWTEGGGAVLFDVGSDATIADIDSADFDGGQLIVLVTNGVPAQDGIFIESVGGVTSTATTVSVGGTQIATYTGGGFGGGNITFTFDADATPAAVQALMRALSYNNNGGDNPTAGTRLVVWTLVDGDGEAFGGDDDLAFNSQVTVTVSNDNPVIADLGGDSATYTEEGPAAFLDSSVAATVTDADSADFNTGSLTVSITANEVAAEDVLGIDTSGTVSLSAGMTVGSVVSVGGTAIGTISSTGAGGADLVVTFNGGATPARVTTLVQALTYANTNTTTPSELARTVSVTVTDGDGGSDSESVTINVVGTPENAPPVIDLNGAGTGGIDNSAAYTENAAPTVLAPTDLTVTDADDTNIESATVQITTGFIANFDYLTVNGATGPDVLMGISFSYSASTGILTLTGSAPLADYQAVLRLVGFESTSDDPGTSRTISWRVNDGDSNSIAALTTITITPINDEPNLTATAGNPTFTEGDAARDLFSGVTITTPESGQTLTSMTLTVTNVTDGANEILIFDGTVLELTNGNSEVTATNGLTVNVSVAAGVATVSFTGASLTPAALQTLVDALAYRNDSQDPTDADRVVTITELVDSGSNTSPDDNSAALSVASTVNVNAVNDPAVITGDVSGDVTEAGGIDNGTAGVPTDTGDLDAADPDDPDDSWQAVAAGGATANGYGTYELTAAGVWTYTLDDDDPAVQALFGAATLTDTFTALTADGTAQVVTITIHAQDDAADARDDAFITDEATAIAGNVFIDNGSGADSDVDNPGTFTVTHVNGSSGDVGVQITLLSGALLRLNANGTFTYDPNGAFDPTTTALSGASNTPEHDGFTYTITGGDTATVNITLSGLDTDDYLLGTLGVDIMDGGVGKDVLDGLGGGDTLNGGAGDDFIYVHAGDSVVEAVGGGYDNVLARETYVLNAGANVEVISTDNHAGTASINITGNELKNVIIGNAGVNVLDGGGGQDRLAGQGGDDFLFVDSADDIVDEAAGGGYDNVLARSSYTLTAGAAVEVMSTDNHAGTAAIDLTGNALNNIIIGNAGANFLDGGNGGIDRLAGLGGDDFLYVGTGDVVDEAAGGGYDNVLARSHYALTFGQHVEVLSTADHGGTTAINLTGNDLDNIVIGNAGSNVIDGSFGMDLLDGLGGVDSYAFTTALGAFNVDTIIDFEGGDGDDKILLENAIFTGLAAGALDPNAFHIGTAAADADDRIIYNSATGQLFFDADGNGSGAQIQFATLEGAPVLTSADFTVI